jgi:hypothetical protein
MYLLGYLVGAGRVYLADKENALVSYSLPVAMLEFQSAVLQNDMAAAQQVCSRSIVFFFGFFAYLQRAHDVFSRYSCCPSSLPRNATAWLRFWKSRTTRIWRLKSPPTTIIASPWPFRSTYVFNGLFLLLLLRFLVDLPP